MKNVIEVKNLSKRYGKHRGIEQVSFEVKKGEIFGFLGPNGAGKSTTIRSMLGLIRYDSGEIIICGHDAAKEREEVLKCIGYMPSEAWFYPGMTIKDVLKFAADVRKLDCAREAEKLCEKLQVDTRRKISELSLGNRKKVSIVCAMQHKPKLLLFDEPTSGLDPGERVRFRNLLSEFAKDRIVVISTHIVSDVEYIANQNAIMKDGKIIENDTTEQLVRLVDGKIWECKIPSSDLVKWERALKLINLRNEADGTTSIRYLSDQAETPDSVSAVPRLEDLYLWLFPQEGEVRL